MDRTMDLINSPDQLTGWTPIRVEWHRNEPLIDWCFTGESRFTEPFFEQSISLLLKKPFNQAFRKLTSIDALRIAATQIPTIKPSGFIFHMSRCGSTLVSRMLAALPQNIMISEAPPLDWMIRAEVRRPEITIDEQINWIRWMAGSLGQERRPDARHFFIKFDSWHMFYFDLIKLAFPDVPWIFLYRDPPEVLVSHSRQTGSALMPGVVEHRLPGMAIEDAVSLAREEYAAIVLARICQAALDQRDDKNGIFVNYNRLPDFVSSDLLNHFSLEYSDDDISTMNAAARYNAKEPTVEFASDTKEKRNEASEDIMFLSEKYLMPIYAGLESAAGNSIPSEVAGGVT